MTATPLAGSVVDVDGAPCVRADAESYPLYATCAGCGGPIRCADDTATWAHTGTRSASCPPLLDVDAVTDRPWTGKCATTGLTVLDFRRLLGDATVEPWITRAAVSLARSYATKRMDVVELAAVIERYRSADCVPIPDKLVAAFERECRTMPQYPGTYEHWMLLCAVDVCDRWSIGGTADPWYVCNTISGELHRANQPRRAR